MHVIHVNLAKEFGGAERQTIALVDALGSLSAKTGFRQTLVVRRNSPFHAHCQSFDGLEMVAIAAGMLKTILAARRGNLVHIHDAGSARAGAVLSLLGVPCVLTHRASVRPRGDFLSRWVYSSPAKIVCVSRQLAQVMKDFSRNASVTTVYDCTRSHPVESLRAVRTTGRLRLAVVGAIDFDRNGQDLLVPCARDLIKRGRDVEFVVVGSGVDGQRLLKMCRDLPNFRILGWVEDVAEVLRDCDALVHPARTEGLGFAILEAMSLGKPVVATRVGDIAEIVQNERNGLLVAPESDQGLASAISRIVVDRDLLADLAYNARATASNHTATVMSKRYYEIYLDVLASRSREALTK